MYSEDEAMVEVRAFWRCLKAHLKMEMMYRTHLMVGIVSQLTFSLLSIVFVGIFLPEGSRIQGWGFWEILFLLGLGDATFGLSAILVFRTFLVFDSNYVLQGELDSLLVQPVNPLFNLLLRNLQVMDIITVLKGVVLATFAGSQAGLNWSPSIMVLFGGAMLLGAAVYSGIFILLFSTGFWFPRRSSVVAPLLSLNQLSQYPLVIYPEWLKLLLSSVLPLGFVAYYPGQFLLESGVAIPAGSALPLWLLVAVPALLLFAATRLFAAGLRHYSGAGS